MREDREALVSRSELQRVVNELLERIVRLERVIEGQFRDMQRHAEDYEREQP